MQTKFAKIAFFKKLANENFGIKFNLQKIIDFLFFYFLTSLLQYYNNQHQLIEYFSKICYTDFTV